MNPQVSNRSSQRPHPNRNKHTHALKDRPLKAAFQQPKYQGPCFPTERWLVWLLIRSFALSRLDWIQLLCQGLTQTPYYYPSVPPKTCQQLRK